VEIFGVNAHRLLGGLLEVLFDDFWCDADDVLALPVFDEIQRLQGTDDVLGFDRRHGTDILDRKVATVFSENLEQHLCPITAKR